MWIFGEAGVESWLWLLPLGGLALTAGGASRGRVGEPSYKPAADPARYAEEIEQLERADAENPPPKGAVLFGGSSSIRLWDLDRWIPGIETVNRGFGGSHIADSIHYADRIILPHEPSVIVFYAGDNDTASGMSPEQVFDHYRLLVAKVHAALPETEIVYLSIKPSLARWSLYPRMRRANELIRGFGEQDPRLHFVDLEPAMLGDDGTPREGLFGDDGLHLSEAGYEVWTEVVMPYVQPGAPVRAQKDEAPE